MTFLSYTMKLGVTFFTGRSVHSVVRTMPDIAKKLQDRKQVDETIVKCSLSMVAFWENIKWTL